MVCFLLAFGFMCLQGSGIPTRSIIATLCGVILILTAWCVWTSWRDPESSDADGPKRTTTLTFEEEHAKQKGFKFTRENSESDTTKPQPPTVTERPAARRSMTLSSLAPTLKLPSPLKKIRRDTSITAVDESIELDEIGNEQLERDTNIRSIPVTITKSL